MKALLWFLLIVGIAANVAASLAFDGGKQAVVSVGTGIVVIGAGVGLYLTRTNRS
ncbi:hypothetical protein [Streptomyces sp. MST-110588]|uniref:hypothetical protein n=1 Tax=Streptomyces sp. MST-110588 TaxID=2833628 RepID=UPI001F5CCB12|nr:hypothetical protein [Streptomyces sp. MST-110588]UNO38433.1 hypothetical protein KGS77_00670 [Streptomyces sp. MST-110588]